MGHSAMKIDVIEWAMKMDLIDPAFALLPPPFQHNG
jgi:hypothetical protein